MKSKAGIEGGEGKRLMYAWAGGSRGGQRLFGLQSVESVIR